MSHPSTTQDFLSELKASVREGRFLRLTLGKPQAADPTLRNLHVRPVILRGQPHLSFVWRHDKRDITKNHRPDEALSELTSLIGETFHNAHLFTTSRTWQLGRNRKGEVRLRAGPAVLEKTPASSHDRPKERLLPEESQAWLHALGVTTESGAVRTGMASKHRQIHKFVEILSHLAVQTPPVADRPWQIVDMGCGKGYLTFAACDAFAYVLERPVRVHGIEVREDLVRLCNRIACETGRVNLDFACGTIESAALPPVDVLIALHACDTATDDALARGIAAEASLIVVAPCCHKELRPLMQAPPMLAPVLRHGIFRERQAEFVTDALRALLLEWAGYRTKVFEFISTEHTAKNLMITATRDRTAVHDEAAAGRVRALAGSYGIRNQALARQLGFALGEA